MHPVILSEITAARIADRPRQAGRRAIVRAARRACGGPAPRHLHLAALVRRALIPLAVRSRAVRARSRPLAACPPVASCAGCTETAAVHLARTTDSRTPHGGRS